MRIALLSQVEQLLYGRQAGPERHWSEQWPRTRESCREQSLLDQDDSLQVRRIGHPCLVSFYDEPTAVREFEASCRASMRGIEETARDRRTKLFLAETLQCGCGLGYSPEQFALDGGINPSVASPNRSIDRSTATGRFVIRHRAGV